MSDAGWILLVAVGALLGGGLGWLLRSRFARQVKSTSDLTDFEFVNSLTQVVYETDMTGRLIFLNQPGLDLFGLTPADLAQGVTVLDLTAPEDRIRLGESLARLREKPLSGNEYTGLTKDGRRFQYRAYSNPIFKDGVAVGIRGMLFDVTENKRAISELKQVNEYLRVMLETAPVAIFDLDREGRVGRLWNRGAERILGWKAEEVYGKVLPTVPEENLDIYYRLMSQSLEGKMLEGADVHRARKDGTPIDYSVYSAPTYDENGEISGNISVLVDVTARKAAERALRESENRFRTIAHNAPVVFFALDSDLQFTMAEGKGSFFPGVDISKVIGHSALEIYHDCPKMVESFQRCLEGREHRIETEIEDFTFDVWFSPQRDEKDGIVGIIGVGTDISKRREVQRELHNSERRFRSLVQNSKDLIFVLDPQGNILYQSPSISQILGYPVMMLAGRSAMELIHPEDIETVNEAFAEVLEHTNPGIPTEFRVRKADDTYIMLEALATDLSSDPAIGGVVITAREITERKRVESELRRLNRALRTTSECNMALVRATDEASLLRDVCGIIVRLGGYQLAWVGYVADAEDGSPVQLVAQAGDNVDYLSKLVAWFNTPEAASNPLLEVTFTHWPMVYSSLSSQIDQVPLAVEAQAYGYASILALPLFYLDENFGCLVIYSDRSDAFDLNEATLLHELAHDLAFGIHTIRVRVANRKSSHLLEQSNADLARAYDATLEGWSHALELRERETAGHSRRVVDLTLEISSRMGIAAEDLIHIRRGALLHDIGKMGIPDSILLKPGPLSADEWVTMRQHPNYAYELLSGIDYLAPAMQIPYGHHERWDGSGYPRGLKGEDIPLAARIFAVVDVWDALTSERPYRPAWPDQAVIDYIKEHSGRLFDPNVVEVFLSL
ncbi:MAG: PAS domain S-box protein [Anaerolineaceae bacterium]|nr:PAS domain S-box protein [Anaerolineaceae bacterium]